MTRQRSGRSTDVFSAETFIADASKPRGAIVKAMAICTRHSFLHIYKVSPIIFAFFNAERA